MVSVTDPQDRPRNELARQNFKIYENGRLQDIADFDTKYQPYSIGIILDLSGSMTLKLNWARQAVSRFIKTANPQNEYFVVGFNNRPELLQDFTSSVDSIQARLATVQAGHGTALFDALDFGLTNMEKARYARKALVVVSDGAGNHSNIPEGKLRGQLRRADVQLYTIGIFEQFPRTPEERNGPQLLYELSEETGGHLYRVGAREQVGGRIYVGDSPDEVAERVSAALRYQYLIAYQSSKPALDGKWRKVKVTINPSPELPQLNIHVRTGYYAPLQ